MKKNRVKRMFISSSILILALFFIPFTKCLIISPVEEQSFTYIPIQPNEVFRIEYTHSIHLSQVEEWYAARNHKIELFKMVYEDTSIGMPSKGDEGTSFRMTEEGKYEISNMNRIFSSFHLRIGQVKANHLLHIKEETIPFREMYHEGTLVEIKVDTLSLWQLWRGVNFHV